MSRPPELFEAHDGRFYHDVDAKKVLSAWYGTSSLVCDRVRMFQDGKVQSFFTVGQNLCGPQARPPMFDKISFQDGIFRTTTSQDDAKEHFKEEVGLSIVPGHNIAGLVIAAAVGRFQSENPDNISPVYLTEFNYIRFRNLILPEQEIAMTGSVETTETSATFSPVMVGEKQRFARNFSVEPGDRYDPSIKDQVLDQHWMIEMAAQGLGMLALPNLRPGMVPILLECGAGEFAKLPIKANDTVVGKLTVDTMDDKLLSGNAELFVGEKLVGNIQDVLLGFDSIDRIREAVENAR